jgi:hypothetical protein
LNFKAVAGLTTKGAADYLHIKSQFKIMITNANPLWNAIMSICNSLRRLLLVWYMYHTWYGRPLKVELPPYVILANIFEH